MRSPVAKHMHKANNRGCFHEEKRDKLLSDRLDKELDESLFYELESQGFESFSLDDIVCSSINIERIDYEHI